MKNLPSLVIPAPACAGVNSGRDIFGDGDDAAVKPIHPLMAAQAAIHEFTLVDPG